MSCVSLRVVSCRARGSGFSHCPNLISAARNLVVVPKLKNPVVAGSGEQPDIAIAPDRTIGPGADDNQRHQCAIIEQSHGDVLGHTGREWTRLF